MSVAQVVELHSLRHPYSGKHAGARNVKKCLWVVLTHAALGARPIYHWSGAGALAMAGSRAWALERKGRGTISGPWEGRFRGSLGTRFRDPLASFAVTILAPICVTILTTQFWPFLIEY